MVLFEESIVDQLNTHFSTGEEYVSYISLMSSGFSIDFVSISIGCNERAFFSSNGLVHIWDGDNPDGGPWGKLVRQLGVKAELVNPEILRIHFESGDYLDIETQISQYESVVIEFPRRENTVVMETF